VQLVYTREDEMICGLYRPAYDYKVSAAIKNNQITGFTLRQAGQGGYSKSRAQRFPMGAIKNLRVEKVRTSSDITTMAWRAPASNTIAFAEQCFMDEVAESLGKDPVSMCLDLLDNAKGKQGMSYEPERMAGAVKLVAEKSNWGNAPEGTFQGFAVYYSHNTYAAEVAEVEMENGVPVIKKVYCAVDCGIVVNPLGAKNQIAGGIIDGIGHSMYGDFPIEDGRPVYQNFDQYRLIRMSETPQVECLFVDSDIEPTGLGEPSLPPAGPAIANAIYAATGVRMTKQPFIQNKEVFG
jgi:isoquinoline 1-oxidoreductase beta subunit